MVKILTQDEIDALITTISEEEEQLPQIRKPQKISAYDFRNPSLLSKENINYLEMVHSNLCRDLKNFLSTHVCPNIDINVSAIEQPLYSDFITTIISPACLYVCDITKQDTQIMIDMNPQLAIFIVEKLFGGKGSYLSEARPISIIEQKITRRVVNRFLVEISRNWSNKINFEVKIQRYESNPESVRIVPQSKPVVIISLQIKINDNISLINICYPYQWISDTLSTTVVQPKNNLSQNQSKLDERAIAEQNLQSTKVTLKALLGNKRISVRDLMKLKENDIIKLGPKTDCPSSVYVNNLKMFSSSIGVRKQKYALRIN